MTRARLARPLACAAAALIGLGGLAEPAGAAVRPLPIPPGYDGHIRPLTEAERTTMTGSSWRPGCPVPLGDLRAIDLPYLGFDGVVHRGTIVVHHDVAVNVNNAFAQLLGARFPFQRVTVVDEVQGSDDRAMAANLTTGFNCRPVAGTRRWSQHAFGRAIDINPVQNPYVSRRVVEPPAGRAYLRRTRVRPGMLTARGPGVRAFRSLGWGWGGSWRSAKDFQHVSQNGR